MHELPPLPYEYNALEPYIDETTMRIHHTAHHKGYADKLNAALDGHPDLQKKTVEELLKNITEVPENIRQAVANQGGGHANHSLWWTSMAPETGGRPKGKIAEAIAATFGSFEEFQESFNKAAVGIFGSGWAWLALNHEGKLVIQTTPNQNSPIMESNTPLLGVDVWEHAYYLRYQNRRQEYLTAWWNVVNWEEIDRRYSA